MIGNRLDITVPADGVYEEHRVSGHLVFVEASPDLTVAGVPTFHLARGGDGIPLYDDTTFIIRAGFDRFFIRGTTASAGSTLSITVLHDPCVEFDQYRLTPAGGGGACPPYVAPTGDPTKYVIHDRSVIEIVGGDGIVDSTVKSGISLSSGNKQGAFYFYFEDLIYFLDHDGVNVELRSIKSDGTGEALVATLGGTGTGAICLEWVPDAGKFVYTETGNTLVMNKDGSGETSIIAFDNDSLAACGNTILIGGGAAGLARYTLAGASIASAPSPLTSNVNAIAYDAETNRVFALRPFSTSTNLYIMGPNFNDPAPSVLANYGSHTTSDQCAMRIYQRWLYYVIGNGVGSYAVYRLYLDDPENTIEQISSGASADLHATTIFPYFN